MNKLKRKFFVSSYNFTLSVIGLIGIAFGCLKFADICVHNYQANPAIIVFSWNNGWLKMVILISFLMLSLIVLLFIEGFQLFGTMEIMDDCLKFSAPFHRSFKMYYKDIKLIGIDFGNLENMTQFWIYFREDEIPEIYYHRINRTKMSKKNMRVLYKKKTLESLIHYLPEDLSKRLEASSLTMNL